jgi:hypothetical protein
MTYTFGVIKDFTISVGWGCNSAVEHLLSISKALGSIPNAATATTTKNYN